MKNSQAAANGELIKNDLTTINQADIIQASMGQAGLEVVSDTAKHTAAAGTCYAVVKFLSDAVVTEIVADASAPITGSLDGLAFGANFALYGKFASIQLASGSAICYLGGV